MSYISDDLDDEIKKYAVNQMLKYFDDDEDDEDLFLSFSDSPSDPFDEEWEMIFNGNFHLFKGPDGFVRESPDTVYDKFDDLPEDKDRNKAQEFIASG